MSAGGYQLEVPAGTYEIIASDPFLGTYAVENVVVGNENVKVDFIIPEPGSCVLSLAGVLLVFFGCRRSASSRVLLFSASASS